MELDAATYDRLERELKDPASDMVRMIHRLLREHVHPGPHLPNMGCMHSMAAMAWADAHIHSLPVERQAAYADMVARAAVHGEEAMKLCFGVSCWEDVPDIPAGANCCAVGGFAYIMLNTDNAGLKAILSDRLQVWVRAQRRRRLWAWGWWLLDWVGFGCAAVAVTQLLPWGWLHAALAPAATHATQP